MASVSLKDVSKAYPGGGGSGGGRGGRRDRGGRGTAGLNAVERFTLEIPDSAFVVLVGPSGCGKSTTLRMIAGLEDITSGTIEIDGKVVNDVPPKDRDIAMVFQNYALYPHMTAYKNMAFPLKMRKVPRDEIDRRVRAAAASLGIENLLHRKPKELSGGQRQRVALGRAIVREPKAFLLDEPLSNLDAKLRLTTRAELKALHLRLKTTTIYVTHDQEEAMTLGDLVVVMSKGLIQQADTPLDIYHKPANRFVASFVGMPPMNFFEGTLRPGASGLEFVIAPAKGGAAPDLVSLPGLSPQLFRDHIGRPLVLGVRPQALEIDRAATGGGWRATVRITELLGDQMDVFATTSGGVNVVARTSAMEPSKPAPRPGDGIGLRAAPERAFLFEPGEFGKRIA